MSTAGHQHKRAITPDDLFEITLVSDPQVSPNGQWIAWVQTRPDRELNGYRASIWVARPDGADARQLTSGSSRDRHPRWSPDSGTIAFVSNRPHLLEQQDAGEKDEPETREPGNGKPSDQIWTIRVDGGEALQRTNHPIGASSPCWSPDGGSIAFVGPDQVSEKDGVTAPSSVGPIADERVIHDVNYRFDGRGFLERYKHVWIADLGDGTSRQLTMGDYNDDEPAWSPDGTRIAIAGNRCPERRRYWNRTGIHVLTVATGEVQGVTPEDAQFSAPAWSQDGGKIAFLGHLGTGSATNDAIWTVTADGSNLLNHSAETDLSFADSGMSDVFAASDAVPHWVDDTTVLALASQRGETQVFRVSTATSNVEQVTAGQHRIAGFAPIGSDLAVVAGRIAQPFELAIWTGDTFASTISRANDTFMAEVELIDAIDLAVTAPDGAEIQAWIIPPRGYDPNAPARHPLILQIHGGPHSMYGYAMFHEMQLMAAKGYAVVFSNPRGSNGYGQEFTACTRGLWGEADMPDVLAAVDAAIQLPWIDADRLGITGGSYGGYLTNWTIGHDQRFKAAVTQRCVSNFYSFFGTSDIGTTFGVTEFDGLPWLDADKLLRHSPVSYVDRIDTPLLILHSEQDLRCPIEQAEQMYASLKYLQKEVSFVRIPDEGHELSRSGTPSRRLARLHHLLGWFDRHL